MKAARERIVRKMDVLPVELCWEWVGNPRENGYCRTTYKGKNWYVHRLSYTAFIGDIPKGLDVCHTCDNRKCCNPYHLFIGTRKQNMEDCKSKGRQARGKKLAKTKRGELAPMSKLKEFEVLQIRDLCSSGLMPKDIAVLYGVSVDTIRKIKKRDSWRHI